MSSRYPSASSLPLTLSALLNILARLLCQGKFPSPGVLGRDAESGILAGGCRADCAVPGRMVGLDLADVEERRLLCRELGALVATVLLLLLLQRRSLPSGVR